MQFSRWPITFSTGHHARLDTLIALSYAERLYGEAFDLLREVLQPPTWPHHTSALFDHIALLAIADSAALLPWPWQSQVSPCVYEHCEIYACTVHPQEFTAAMQAACPKAFAMRFDVRRGPLLKALDVELVDRDAQRRMRGWLELP